MDRDIVRFLYKNKSPANQRQIAKNVGLSPSATKPRLKKLENQGILKPVKTSRIREFERAFKNKPKKKIIKAPRSVYWGIDLIDKTKKRGK